jgi:hypothetical protein
VYSHSGRSSKGARRRRGVAVGEHVAAMDQRDRAHMPAHVARQPGVALRVHVACTHAVADGEACGAGDPGRVAGLPRPAQRRRLRPSARGQRARRVDRFAALQFGGRDQAALQHQLSRPRIQIS